ncbi:MAG: fibronectin type III domain-containing protein, partial [Thermoguttaceae bacterium]|nr:fibronectin type III domain-containing protein [Thermoguttaceae bacterium]
MLSVSAAEFAAIQTLYSDLNLPDSCNIIEITASQLSQTKLEASLAAAQSVDNGVVVVRTTNSANTIIVTSELNVPAGVTLVSYGATDLTLNAEENCRVMTTGANVKLGGLVITGGLDKGVWDTSNRYYATYTARGGGINATGALTLDQCAVVANGAVADARTYQENVKSYAYGGGIYSASGVLTIYDSSINGNQAYAEGGIGSEGVEGWNTESCAEAYAYGGGVYASTVTIVNGELSNNEAKAQGGTCSATKASSGGDYVSLNNMSPFAESPAKSYGGGIYAGTLTITDGVVSHNAAVSLGGDATAHSISNGAWSNGSSHAEALSYGGGIYSSSSLTITNSLIHDNGAFATGGAAYGDANSYYANSYPVTSAETLGGGAYAGGSVVSLNTSITDNKVESRGGTSRALNSNNYKYSASSRADATARGGGLWHGGSSYNTPSSKITNNTVCGNSARAIAGSSQVRFDSYIETGQSGSTASSKAEAQGGGILGGVATIYNSVIVNNEIEASGGPTITSHEQIREDASETSNGSDVWKRFTDVFPSAYSTLSTCVEWKNGAQDNYQYANQTIFGTPVDGYYPLAANSYAKDKGNAQYWQDGLQYDDNGVLDLGAYDARVHAVKLDTPTYKSSSSTASSITVAWNPVTNASGYVVEYRNATDTSYTVMPTTTATTLTIPDLAADTTYKLRVYAVGDGVNYSNSDYSSVKEVKTPAPTPTPLTAPTITTTTSTDASITVKWDAVANASGYVVAYRKSTDADWTVLAPTTATSQTISSLAANTTYNVKVFAKGDGTTWSDSDDSAVVSVKTQPKDLTPLDAPTWKSSSPTSSSITVVWNAVANASGYVVEYKGPTDTTFTAMPETTATTLTISNLEPETTYKFHVLAVGDGTSYSDSVFSAVKAVKTKAGTRRLTAPAITTTTSTISSITVKWDAVANASGYVVAYKKSTESDSSWTVLAQTTATSRTISSLAANTTYNVKVFAKGDGTTWSDSDDSAIVSVKTQPKDLTPLDAPTWKSSSPTSSSITVVW